MIILSVLRSDCRGILIDKHAAELDAALTVSESIVKAKGEEGEYEAHLVNEIRDELAHPSPLPTASNNTSTSTSADTSNNDNSNNSSSGGAVIAISDSH